MSTDSPAETLDRVSPRRLGSLRLRLTLGVPLLTCVIVAVFEWSQGGFEAPAEGLARAAWLVLLLSAAQLMLVEALLLRPLRQLAAGCEAMESAPVPLTPDPIVPAPRLTAELDRIGHAMRRARGSLWQQDQDAREL
ncbi:MAG: hypothetical protein EOP39_30155, partial [Rubrivivax sp.]